MARRDRGPIIPAELQGNAFAEIEIRTSPLLSSLYTPSGLGPDVDAYFFRVLDKHHGMLTNDDFEHEGEEP